MEEYKLLIETKFKFKKKLIFFKKQLFPIQNETFEIIISIKNIGDNIFPGAKLGNVTIRSMDSKTIFEKIYKEFSVPIINPDNVIDVHVGSMTTHLYGLVWIETPVIPNNPEQQKITIYQKDAGTGEPIYPQLNKAGDSSFIQSSAETESAFTNSLILFLTVLLFLETIFGLKNIVDFFLNSIGKFFIKLGNLIIR